MKYRNNFPAELVCFANWQAICCALLTVQTLLKNPTQRYYMKPTFQISPIWKGIDNGNRFGRHERKFPEIDFDFHGLAHSRPIYSAPNLRPTGSFHRLGTRYLSQETGRDFVADAVVFGLIVAVSAWPILSMIHALAERFH